jgi:hypothetical protein
MPVAAAAFECLLKLFSLMRCVLLMLKKAGDKNSEQNERDDTHKMNINLRAAFGSFQYSIYSLPANNGNFYS